MDSRSDAFLRVTRLVSDLHQRTSLDIPALLGELVAVAVESVPGARYAAVTVSTRGRLSEAEAATDSYPVVLADIQNRCQEGPTLTAGALQESIRIDDLAGDDRWPRYRDEALRRTPIRSILSLGMFREGATTASLDFYAEDAHAFDDRSVDLGSILTTHAGLVWNMTRRDQQFRAALASRDVIGQAKGRMMERFNIGASRAFEMLKLMSQNSNTPIAQVAQRVVTGEVLPVGG